MSTISRTWQLANPERHAEHQQRYAISINAINRVRIWQEKRALGCSRCGYNEHGAALDWHHPAQDKERRFTVRGYYSALQTLERAKCILLCANCHRVEHVLPDALNISDANVKS